MVTEHHLIATFDKLIQRLRYLLKLLGLDSYDPSYRPNIRTVIVLCLAALYMMISMYDLVHFSDDLFNFVYVLITFFFATIGIGRTTIYLSSGEALQFLLAETYRTYREVREDEREQRILCWYTNIYRWAVDTYARTFLVTSIIMGLGPLINFLVTGEQVLPFGVVLPFVDSNSGLGYVLNYLYQLSCILWTGPGLMSSYCLTLALVANICIQYDILAVKLADLDEDILSHADDLVARKLRDIIRDQQRVERFVGMIEATYRMVSGVEVLSLGLQVIITLFVMQISFWMPGLFMIPLFSGQLFIFCALGAAIQHKSESFAAGVYRLSWHELPRREKQTFRIMLQRSQNSQKLTCSQISDINLNLFVTMSQKFYSIFTMLRSF
ncbi:putative odorant receptor 83c [Anopheles ziemanni]|uniref:putative odorant receptor 83c n=1 Tax=Anopheles coustani TaxID=139045 RepID=UPI002658BE3F|nr:putative odorant receptor 83c [Anopheles coustani]XP_058176309.1 putative odorant receptor 83c [Anopheles ziemanni]